MAWSTPSVVATGDLIAASDWNQNTVYNPIALTPHGFSLVASGGGGVIGAGVKGYVEVPAKCDIDRVTIVGDASGTLQFDINKAGYATVPTFSTITGGNEPALSSAQKYQDSSLTGWTTALSAGDWLEIEVDASPAPATVTLATLALKVSYS